MCLIVIWCHVKRKIYYIDTRALNPHEMGSDSGLSLGLIKGWKSTVFQIQMLSKIGGSKACGVLIFDLLF